jgi:hypothetical protein
MPRIVAALFEDQAAAQRALQAMLGTGVARDRIAITGESEGRNVSSISGFRELSARDAQAALHDLPLPDDDLRAFEAGLRQGHVLLSARIDGENIEEAINVLEMFDPIDLDNKSEAWQRAHGGSSGSSGGSGGAMRGGVDVGAPLGAGITGGAMAGTTNTSALPGTGSLTTGTHDAGTSDLRTQEVTTHDMGVSSTQETGSRREDARAGAPGVMELAEGQTVNPAAGQGFMRGGDRYRRELNRTGRVRAYSRD